MLVYRLLTEGAPYAWPSGRDDLHPTFRAWWVRAPVRVGSWSAELWAFTRYTPLKMTADNGPYGWPLHHAVSLAGRPFRLVRAAFLTHPGEVWDSLVHVPPGRWRVPA